MDLKNLTNEELQVHKVAVLTEIERRQFMEDALDQARDLGSKYEQNGGDPAVLAGEITGDNGGDPNALIESVMEA